MPTFLKPLLAYGLLALLLVQTFSRELLVVDYALNRATITARFCVNKARPVLRCNGKCYFAKQLKKQQERENNAPNPLRDKLEVLPAPFAAWQPCPPRAFAAAAPAYARLVPGTYAAPRGRVFHPPLG